MIGDNETSRQRAERLERIFRRRPFCLIYTSHFCLINHHNYLASSQPRSSTGPHCYHRTDTHHTDTATAHVKIVFYRTSLATPTRNMTPSPNPSRAEVLRIPSNVYRAVCYICVLLLGGQFACGHGVYWMLDAAIVLASIVNVIVGGLICVHIEYKIKQEWQARAMDQEKARARERKIDRAWKKEVDRVREDEGVRVLREYYLSRKEAEDREWEEESERMRKEEDARARKEVENRELKAERDRERREERDRDWAKFRHLFRAEWERMRDEEKGGRDEENRLSANDEDHGKHAAPMLGDTPIFDEMMRETLSREEEGMRMVEEERIQAEKRFRVVTDSRSFREWLRDRRSASYSEEQLEDFRFAAPHEEFGKWLERNCVWVCLTERAGPVLQN